MQQFPRYITEEGNMCANVGAVTGPKDIETTEAERNAPGTCRQKSDAAITDRPARLEIICSRSLPEIG